MPSLADEIADLLNPAPRDVDGDQDGDGYLTAAERPSLLTDSERASAAAPAGGRRMRGAGIQMSAAEAARSPAAR